MLSEGCLKVVCKKKTPNPELFAVLAYVKHLLGRGDHMSNCDVGVRLFPPLFHTKIFCPLFPLLCLLSPIYRVPFIGVCRLLTFILGKLFTSWTCHGAITHQRSSPALTLKEIPTRQPRASNLPAAKPRFCLVLRPVSACPAVLSLALLFIHLQKWFAAFDASPMRSFTSKYRSKTLQMGFWRGLIGFSELLPHSLAPHLLGHHSFCLWSCSL